MKRTKRTSVGIIAPTDEAIARVVELAKRWERLKRWGVNEKLPHTRNTQKDLERFFQDLRNAKGFDVSEVTSVTADVRRLEAYAEEHDAARNVPNPFKREALTTSFDIENADHTLKAAKKVVESSNAVQAAARDASKDAFALVKDAAKVVPWWAWLAGGGVVFLYVLGKVATIAHAFKSE